MLFYKLSSSCEYFVYILITTVNKLFEMLIIFIRYRDKVIYLAKEAFKLDLSMEFINVS